MVLSQEKVSRWAWTGINSVSWSRTSKRPALLLWKSDLSLRGAVLRRDQLLALSHLEAWTLFLRAPFSGTGPRVCGSLRWLLEEFQVVFCVKVHTNPEVDSPIALGNLDFFHEHLVSGSHSPRMRQSEPYANYIF